MDQVTQNDYNTKSTSRESSSIFDDLRPLPVYYSELAITLFAFFGSTMFGSILMAMNCARNEGKRGMWQVLVFGVLYTVMEISIIGFLPISNSSGGSSLNIGLSLGGALILRYFIWPAYIGKNVQYIRRSVAGPLIVAAVVFAVLVGLIVLATMAGD